LGKEGLEWLKIHLVNMTGHKKQASNSERLAYAEELMANAFESADNPLEVSDAIRMLSPSLYLSPYNGKVIYI